jgi:hypothetical protein
LTVLLDGFTAAPDRGSLSLAPADTTDCELDRRFGAILNRPATGKVRERARVGRWSVLVLAWRADYY